MEEDKRPRHLTDADVEAIVSTLQVRVVKRFYTDLGRGVWGLAWRGIVLGLVAIAAYGAWKNGG